MQLDLMYRRFQALGVRGGLRRAFEQRGGRGVDLVLRCETGGKLVAEEAGNLVGRLGESGTFEQAVDDAGIHFLRIEVPCGLHGEAELGDVVIHAVGHVGLAQEEVGGDAEGAGEADDALVAELVRFAAQEATERAFRRADAQGEARPA